MIRSLWKDPSLIHHTNSVGDTILHHIVKKCSLDELIEVKDDRYIAMLADKQNMGGWTPGGLAERLGKGEMGRVLFRDSMR